MKVFVAEGALLPRGVTDDFLTRFGADGRRSEIRPENAGNMEVKARLRYGVAGIGAVGAREAGEFLREQPLEASFARFVDFCRDQGFEVSVVSDGLDFCLERMFTLKGIGSVRTYANRVEMEGTGESARWQVSFPYDDAECTRCACCARNIMLTTCADDDRIVFVGTDEKDVCPAEYADVVFAQAALQSACQERNISYFLYSSFDDVAERLLRLSTKRNLRPRREAAMKRRDAFIAEW
jgi:2-hydroxy-3-keto-5-methylthiopentenyl-1-phosphate phosphatase